MSSSLSHFIGDLSTEFGMDNIWGVNDRGVPEVVRLLSVLFLVKENRNIGGCSHFVTFKSNECHPPPKSQLFSTQTLLFKLDLELHAGSISFGAPRALQGNRTRHTSLMRSVALLEPSICRAPVAIQAAPRR